MDDFNAPGQAPVGRQNTEIKNPQVYIHIQEPDKIESSICHTDYSD